MQKSALSVPSQGTYIRDLPRRKLDIVPSEGTYIGNLPRAETGYHVHKDGTRHTVVHFLDTPFPVSIRSLVGLSWHSHRRDKRQRHREPVLDNHLSITTLTCGSPTTTVLTASSISFPSRSCEILHLFPTLTRLRLRFSVRLSF